MKKILSLVASLTAICAICAAILAYVNDLTSGPIAAMKVRQENDAVKAVMPEGVSSVEAKGDFYIGKDDSGNILGYAAKGKDGGGYGGDIVLMVGFKADKKTLVCYKTLAASETPGLGMKLNDPGFKAQFPGKNGTSLKVVKGATSGVDDIAAITSATITSKAVCRAIADAAAKL